MTDYRMLSGDDREAMLWQRLKLYEQQHFDAAQNLLMARATHAADAQVAELEKRTADLETCMEIVVNQLEGGDRE